MAARSQRQTQQLDDIKTRISDHETERAGFVSKATQWEAMFLLKHWSKSARESVEMDGREQVTLPDPYNVVMTGQRLISAVPKIQVPSSQVSDEGDTNARARQKWLMAMYGAVKIQQREDVVSTLIWQSMVRGRFAYEMKWIRPILPKPLRDKRFPIMFRPLDPMDIGFQRGPYWTEFAYHKENVPRWRIAAQYPNLKLRKQRPNGQRTLDENELCELTDYWWTEDDGDIWNAIIVDDEFGVAPYHAENYTEIPIYEGYADLTGARDEAYKSLSILYPMEGTWSYMNRLMSQMATAMLWYFWPHIAVQNELGQKLPTNLRVRPGETRQYPWGTKIEMIQMSPNVPLASTLSKELRDAQEQATFGKAIYGESGSMQAGYGLNIMTDAARGRTSKIREGLELGLQYANRLALGFVQNLGGSKGVTIYGRDDASNEMYELSLNATQVEDFYENFVTLAPSIPQDSVQRTTLGIQLHKEGAISLETMRNKFIDIELPTDEQHRIDIEKALAHPAMEQKNAITAFATYMPEGWEEIIKGTELEQAAQMYGMLPTPPPTPQEQAAAAAPPMPVDPMAMQPAMPQQMPMQPAMPMQPDQMAMQAPPMPPEQMGISPAPISTPMGGGIPPDIQTGLTPEQMGLGSGQGAGAQLDPMLYQELLGRGMTDADIQALLLQQGG
jgi:hypothetical protein